MRKKLKERRKEFGYTQETFAKEIGISTKSYQAFEQGSRFTSESIIRLIMDKLEFHDISLLNNEKNESWGDVTNNICDYMNGHEKDKVYSKFHIAAIRKAINLELKNRKKSKLMIRSNTRSGKNIIYQRIAAIATKESSLEITANDVKLYKQCARQEYTDRTGRCTWGIPEVRTRLGHNPVTGVLKKGKRLSNKVNI